MDSISSIKTTVKLGTRTSPLALWQAELVATNLSSHVQVSIEGISTHGDIDLKSELHTLGGTGVFTKAIDEAVLSGEIDLGVHSLKDYPTQSPEGLEILAIIERDYHKDVFIPGGAGRKLNEVMQIASGSPRRKAQWLNRYPQHEFVSLRGNMAKRLEKIASFDGGIISEAGIKRLGIYPENAIQLDWMIPAPAQGTIAVVGRKNEEALKNTVQQLTHKETAICVTLERSFMQHIEAGCAAPLGAFAYIYENMLQKGLPAEFTR